MGELGSAPQLHTQHRHRTVTHMDTTDYAPLGVREEARTSPPPDVRERSTDVGLESQQRKCRLPDHRPPTEPYLTPRAVATGSPAQGYEMSDAMRRGRWSSRKVPLRFPQRSSRGHPKDPPQAPQGSAHGSPQGSAGPPEGSSEAAPAQGCPKGSPRVHLRVHPKIPPRVSPRAFHKAPPRVPPKGPPKGSAQRSPVCAWLSCGDGRGPKARVQYIYIYTTLRVSSWGGPETWFPASRGEVYLRF